MSNVKDFTSMVRLQKQFAKLYGTRGAGLLGVAEEYVQVQEEVFAALCFDVLGTFDLRIQGGRAALDVSGCTYIQLRVFFDEVDFHALASSSEWDAVGFPMTESIQHAQAELKMDYVPGSKHVHFWALVLAHLVYLLREQAK